MAWNETVVTTDHRDVIEQVHRPARTEEAPDVHDLLDELIHRAIEDERRRS
jgi:hypothetical protein